MADRAAEPVPQPATPARNAHVHGARGLFAFSLFAFHVLNSGLAPAITADPRLQQAGFSLSYGVELFFGISGLVIAGAHARAPGLGAFLIERCTRIYPVLWATIGTIVLLHAVAPPDADRHWHPLSPAGYLANALAATPLVPFALIHPAAWSLSYEFAFYIGFGLWFAKWRGRIAARTMLGVVATLAILTHIRAVFFVSGAMIARGWFANRRIAWLIAVPEAWLLGFLVVWSGLGSDLGWQFGDATVPRVFQLGPQIALGWVCGTLALAGLTQGRGALARLLLTPALQWLGTISYSLYLWQSPVMAIVKHAMLANPALLLRLGNGAQLALFAAALPPTLAVSALSQHWLEARASRWLRRHAYALIGQRGDRQPARRAAFTA